MAENYKHLIRSCEEAKSAFEVAKNAVERVESYGRLVHDDGVKSMSFKGKTVNHMVRMCRDNEDLPKMNILCDRVTTYGPVYDYCFHPLSRFHKECKRPLCGGSPLPTGWLAETPHLRDHFHSQAWARKGRTRKATQCYHPVSFFFSKLLSSCTLTKRYWLKYLTAYFQYMYVYSIKKSYFIHTMSLKHYIDRLIWQILHEFTDSSMVNILRLLSWLTNSALINRLC